MRLDLKALLALTLCLMLHAGVLAQSNLVQDALPDPESPLKLTLGTRLVIEDVLVTDRQGKPVTGLPESAFHITDQGRPQTIRGFDPSNGSSAASEPSPPPALPPGTFASVDYTDTNSVWEAILIDADDLELTDQLYLLDQLKKSLRSLPPSLRVALLRVVNGHVVAIQGMTNDPAVLERALHECLPIIPHAIDSKFESAIGQLLTTSAYLEQYPGRKNLLWFAGAFPLVPITDAELSPRGVNPDYAARLRVVHHLQEELAEARIAVYPFDARGVMAGTRGPDWSDGGPPATRSMGAASGFTRTPTVPLPGGFGVSEGHDVMTRFAEATGGKAFMDNWVDQEVNEAFGLSQSGYAISFSPADWKVDDSWHRVRITVDGDYHLSYRPGYLASWTAMPGGRPGNRLQADGSLRTGQQSRAPLDFTVQCTPEAAESTPGRAPTRLAVTYRIPVRQLDFIHGSNQWTSVVSVTTYAYDEAGRIRSSRSQELDTTLSDEKYAAAGGQLVAVAQSIDLPKQATHLLMIARDSHSKRVGSVMISTRALSALPAEKP